MTSAPASTALATIIDGQTAETMRSPSRTAGFFGVRMANGVAPSSAASAANRSQAGSALRPLPPASWHVRHPHGSFDVSYEMNKIPVISGSGQIPTLQVPIMSEANQWTPVSPGQIMQEGAMYPSGTFYLPNAFGDPLQVVGGAPKLDAPVVPVMTSGS